MSTVRRNLMLGTAGHVDHGKSALVKLLTGCETDTLAEEKERGLTIDLGFAPCKLSDNRVVGIVDVPGHVDFIRNMVAGAHGVDVVIFVVAADDGIMPQTHEHLQILTLMGLRHGLVALTKIDLVPPERRAAVEEDLRRLLAATFLAEAPICPISNITGQGFDGFFEALNTVVTRCGERPTGGIFRMWVEDVFTIRGAGCVVTGIPVRGRVRVQDSLVLLPAGQKGHVRRMQVYGEDSVEAKAGECVALNVPELDHEKVQRGMLLCGSEELAPAVMAEAELNILASLKGTLKDRCEVQLHIGTAALPAEVAMLESAEMRAGSRQFVQLRWAEPLPLVPGERFVLRANVAAQGQSGVVTIGGGRILGLNNVRLRRRKQWTPDRLQRRYEALDEPQRWCELMLREASRPLMVRELERNCCLRPEELSSLLAELAAQGQAVQTPTGGWVAAALVEGVAGKMLDALEKFHAANPERSGMTREEFLTTAAADAEISRLAADHLLKGGRVQENGAVIARPGWSARLPDKDQKLAEQVAAAFQAAKWAGPTAPELAPRLAQPPAQIEKVMRLLAERGVLAHIEGPLYIHREALEAARRVVLGLFAKRLAFSTMEFRDALGVSRKYAVPLLDYLDRSRFTVRTGHDRTPGSEAKKLMSASAVPQPRPQPAQGGSGT